MTRRRLTGAIGALLPLLLAAAPAFADDAGPPKIDSGDTAWMLASTALVLLMTVPGLALFYGGMVRKKNILATLMQCFVITCIVTIVWTVAGYSLAFTPGNTYVGDLSRFMLHGIADHISKGNDTQAFVLESGIKDVAAMSTTIPETVYMMFQMTFAIITPALIVGAFADRMKFSALCIFMTLWSLLIYSPVAHWMWAPSGWAAQNGQLDFAGGTVVHINAGIAGLMCALVLGKRVGYGSENMAPYNLA
jgi:Amt family ammonium transporter